MRTSFLIAAFLVFFSANGWASASQLGGTCGGAGQPSLGTVQLDPDSRNLLVCLNDGSANSWHAANMPSATCTSGWVMTSDGTSWSCNQPTTSCTGSDQTLHWNGATSTWSCDTIAPPPGTLCGAFVSDGNTPSSGHTCQNAALGKCPSGYSLIGIFYALQGATAYADGANPGSTLYSCIKN